MAALFGLTLFLPSVVSTVDDGPLHDSRILIHAKSAWHTDLIVSNPHLTLFVAGAAADLAAGNSDPASAGDPWRH